MLTCSCKYSELQVAPVQHLRALSVPNRRKLLGTIWELFLHGFVLSASLANGMHKAFHRGPNGSLMVVFMTPDPSAEDASTISIAGSRP